MARRTAAARARTSGCSPLRRDLPARARPAGGRHLSTGDEVVPPRTRQRWRRARYGTRRPAALAGLVNEAGACRAATASSPTTAPRWSTCCVTPWPSATWSWCQPARRSVPATRRRARSSGSARPESSCHGIAMRPGKPTLLAQCGGVPVRRAARQPAVGVGRVPAGGHARGPPGRWVHAGCARPRRAGRGPGRQVASLAGRLDVVQVRLREGLAMPLFGRRPCCRCSPSPTATSSYPRRRPASMPAPRSMSRCTDTVPRRGQQPVHPRRSAADALQPGGRRAATGCPRALDGQRAGRRGASGG